MQLQIIPFKARHVQVIKPDASVEMLNLAKIAEAKGYAFTGCLMGDPIGAAGIAIQHPGVGEAWTLFSPLLKAQFRVTLLRMVRKLINDVTEEAQLRDIYCYVLPDDLKAQEFVEELQVNGDHPRLTQFLYQWEVRR